MIEYQINPETYFGSIPPDYGEKIGNINDKISTISEIVAYITGLLDSNFAVPPFRLLNAIKLVETISRVNHRYHSNLQSFFDALTKFRNAKEKISPYYAEPELTLTKGKLTQQLPKFTVMGVIKTVLFILFYLSSGPLSYMYKFMAEKQVFKSLTTYKIILRIFYYKNLFCFSLFTSFLIDGAFQCASVLTIVYSGSRKVDITYNILSHLAILSSIFLVFDMFKESFRYQGQLQKVIFYNPPSKKEGKLNRFPVSLTMNSSTRLKRRRRVGTQILDGSNPPPVNASLKEIYSIEKEQKFGQDLQKCIEHNKINRALMKIGTSDIATYKIALMKYNFYRDEETRDSPVYEHQHKWTPSFLLYLTSSSFYGRTLIYQIMIPLSQNWQGLFFGFMIMLETFFFYLHAFVLVRDYRRVNRLSVISKVIQGIIISLFASIQFLCNIIYGSVDNQPMLIGELCICIVILSLLLGYICSISLFVITISDIVTLLIKGRRVINLVDSQVPREQDSRKKIRRRGGNPKRAIKPNSIRAIPMIRNTSKRNFVIPTRKRKDPIKVKEGLTTSFRKEPNLENVTISKSKSSFRELIDIRKTKRDHHLKNKNKRRYAEFRPLNIATPKYIVAGQPPKESIKEVNGNGKIMLSEIYDSKNHRIKINGGLRRNRRNTIVFKTKISISALRSGKIQMKHKSNRNLAIIHDDQDGY